MFADYWLAGKRLAFHDFTLDSSPGWTMKGARAFGQPTIYVRWSYAVIQERAYPYSGWNIDDI
ncbi:MAG: hypothetical protein ACYTEQ_19340 [Planctomycetota bacterium]